MKNLILFALLLSSAAYAQEIIPGLIPRFYSIEAATDLPIPPDVAHKKALSGFDLSTLDPNPNTNIWNPGQSLIPEDALATKDETLEFVKTLPSRDGQLRFSVQNKDRRELIVSLSKKAHNFLMRRNILAKLGYNTQPMSWVSRIKLEFADSIDRDLFKEDMKDKLFAGTERWVTAENDLVLTVQDALVLTPDTDIYNLATGVMAPEIHQGRRLLRAPYVPLALVDATESLNLMSWQAGRVVLDNLKLNQTQDLDTGYGTSWEDARWIGRRMAKLTRADFEEIVWKSKFPDSASYLLVEKLIARRNDLMELLKLDSESKPIAFNPQVSFPPGLIDGEIVQEFFDGYATRFSYGDPESPFSAAEIGSYAISRIQAELMNGAIEALNKLLESDDQKNYVDELKKIIMRDGPYFPTQGILVPSYHGALILSRDIVTGTYLGTNNKVQLVDNFGYAVNLGVLGGVEGLPIPLDLKGGSSMSFQRVFSHVKPVTTLKKSLKEPYKNLIVPMLMRNLGKKIDKLTKTKPDEALIQSVVTDLKNTLSIGESFIITDSIVPTVYAEADLSVSQFVGLPKKVLGVYARIQSQRAFLTRFHLHRPDENTFQIYQDYGKNFKLMLTMKLHSYVPILSFKANWTKATAETQMYPISLDSRNVTVDILKGLRQSVLSLNHSGLREVVKPHKVEDKITGTSNSAEFLIWKRNRFGNAQKLTLTHAKGGEQKTIWRRYDAITTGVDYEGYARDAVNSLLRSLLDSDMTLTDVAASNPGFTTGGKAKNKIFTSEFDGSRMTTNYQRILNGWKVTQDKMKPLLEQINKEAGRKVFDPITVINTDSILLYQISFIYTMTQEGSQNVLNASEAKLRQVIATNAGNRVGSVDSVAASYLSRLKKIQLYMRGSDVHEGMEKMHDWLKDFQDMVTVKGLEDLCGTTNIAYQGRIEGFRQGDENGDSPVFSNVFGNLPLPLNTMPTQQVMQNWGILEGELTASWMLERAI